SVSLPPGQRCTFSTAGKQKPGRAPGVDGTICRRAATDYATRLMYRKILVALENSQADEALLPHVAELAKRLHSELLLVHVADGWVARNFEQLRLAESQEMKDDRNYLMETAAKLRAAGLEVSAHLALGDPPTEIIRTAEREQ